MCDVRQGLKEVSVAQSQWPRSRIPFARTFLEGSDKSIPGACPVLHGSWQTKQFTQYRLRI